MTDTVTPAQATRPGLSLQLTSVIPAPRSRVFAAWTNPELLKTWFAPGNMTVPHLTTDLRIGGAYRIEMQGTLDVHNGTAETSRQDPIVVAHGIYTDILPRERLAYTWSGSWNPAEESSVTVSLAETPSGTRLTITHAGFDSEQSRETHSGGWKSSLAKLSQLVASKN